MFPTSNCSQLPTLPRVAPSHIEKLCPCQYFNFSFLFYLTHQQHHYVCSKCSKYPNSASTFYRTKNAFSHRNRQQMLYITDGIIKHWFVCVCVCVYEIDLTQHGVTSPLSLVYVCCWICGDIHMYIILHMLKSKECSDNVQVYNICLKKDISYSSLNIWFYSPLTLYTH